MKLTLERQIDLWFVLSLLIVATICPVPFPGTLVTLALFASLGMFRCREEEQGEQMRWAS